MPAPRIYRVDHGSGSMIEPWHLTNERYVPDTEFRRIRSDAFMEANRRLRERVGNYTVIQYGNILAEALRILTREYGFEKAEVVS